MSGIIAWNYFSDCLLTTSNTFRENSAIFGKVYFPRLILPLSKVISSLSKFFVQLILFFGLYTYFLFNGNTIIKPSIYAFLYLPLMILQMAFLGQGIGMIISSLTNKYRDLAYLVTFGTQLLMYASPIVYPLSVVPDDYKTIILANPMTPIIEGFRYAFIGNGVINTGLIFYSISITIIIFLLGLIVFNKVEKSFIDIV